MRKIEKLRKEYMSYGRWYYHLVLDSLGEQNLLNTRDQCVNAMNTVAIAQYLYGTKIVQFDWMRNHGHFTLYADGIQCCHTFDYYRKRLNGKLVEDGYPPIPRNWFFRLRRLDSLNDLRVAVSYSGRNSYDARGDILPSGYLWSSNYLLFSDISELLEYKTIGEYSARKVSRLLRSDVALPSGYKVGKLGFILPESYLMKADGGLMTKAQSLYKDSKDYTYRLFRDYDTYRKAASDVGETWSPSGQDVDSLIDNLLSYGYGVNDLRELDYDKKCDLAVRLLRDYGLESDAVSSRLKLSGSAVSRLLYSYNKKKR